MSYGILRACVRQLLILGQMWLWSSAVVDVLISTVLCVRIIGLSRGRTVKHQESESEDDHARLMAGRIIHSVRCSLFSRIRKID